MGFRINRGIFQFKDGTEYINKFKIDDVSGELVEVDPKTGDPVDGYLRTSGKAADANLLDGLDSGAFIRSNADDNVSGNTEWQDNKQIRLGNGADFRMWHDGSHTIFRNYNHSAGNIYFQGEATDGNNHGLLYMINDVSRPYLRLFEDGGERLRTTSTGITVYGDHYVDQGRIHVKRGTGLTHTEWEDDSSANGRAQLILDSHYSDLIIASRNSNSNRHGSTLTFATQSTSTNDVAKWVIGQGQYQEGAHQLAFAYGVNQTNPHSIQGTDNANAEMVLTNGSGIWLRNALHADGGVHGSQLTVDGTTNGGRIYADDWGVKIGTSSGHIQFGPANTSWAHIYTDRANFYFNKNIYVSGNKLATQGYVTGRGYITQTTADGRYDASGTAQTLVDAAKEELLNGAIANAQTTADNAATAAATATNNANTALERADGTKLAVAELGDSLGTAAYTNSTAYLGATAKAVDSDKVDGYHASQLWRRTSGTNGTAGAGWMTVASAGDGGRWSGEVIVTDGESSDHSFIRIHWMRSYQDSNFVVLNCGGHSNRITGARVLYESSDNTYGKKYLQVYVTTSSNYYVRVTQEGDTPNFSTISAVTPVIENSKSGYAVHGAELTGLEHASLAAEEGIKVGGTIYTNSHGNSSNWNAAYNWGNHANAGYLASNGKAADADKLDGYDWGQSGKNIRGTEIYADGWLRNYTSGKGLYNQATTQHFYSDSDDYWNVAGGSNQNGIRFRDEHGGTIRGYVLANNSNQIGFLDAGGSWGVRHDNDSGTLFYTDGGTLEFRVGRDKVTGNYGTVQTETTRGGWGGYSIDGRVVFMHDHGNWWGIYNDVNNEWMIRGELNGRVELRHNSATKLETTSTGVTISGTATATAFSGDGSGLTNLPIPAPSIPALIFGMENTEITSVEITDRGEMRFNLANGQAIYLDGIRPSIR